jgi:DNA primase
MVTETTKWVLTHTNIDPLKIANTMECSERECWEYLEELNAELNIAEKQRRKESQEPNKQVETFREEIGKQGEEIRRKILINKLKKVNEEDAKPLLREVAAYMGRVEITPEMKERAREYPITELIEHKRMMAKCPFHNEENASMYLKNNFYHCFSCGANGDTISLVMHIKGLTFPQAVQYLTYN